LASVGSHLGQKLKFKVQALTPRGYSTRHRSFVFGPPGPSKSGIIAGRGAKNSEYKILDPSVCISFYSTFATFTDFKTEN